MSATIPTKNGHRARHVGGQNAEGNNVGMLISVKVADCHGTEDLSDTSAQRCARHLEPSGFIASEDEDIRTRDGNIAVPATVEVPDHNAACRGRCREELCLREGAIRHRRNYREAVAEARRCDTTDENFAFPATEVGYGQRVGRSRPHAFYGRERAGTVP